ncbi:MAG: 3-oxoacyl-[acyl-carrier-protein] synthase III C-terminal domain-containing protein [Deltaproteobacteria bacterium]
MIGKMLIESLGVYLPTRIVSTDEVLRGCRVRLRFPLERVTGIAYRHVAGDNEFSVELAQKAILDCLSRSKYEPEDIDLIISCDTSHSTGFLKHSAEPATALRLQRDFGLTNALAFDVTNACAGIFTALVIVQSLLAAGAIRNALVVSGEHITHLVRTAQLEIESVRDPRLACLTLGDAGVALILEQTDNGAAGFEPILLQTLGEHSSLCIGKQTDRSHGGAVMLTESGLLARVAIEESVNRTLVALRGNGWFPRSFQHCIMHQTARISVEQVMRVLNRKSGQKVLHPQNTINNLRHRGNTASTTHFVALMDHVRNGQIESGQRVVFGVAASGVTSGTALYTLDDLPDRLRRPTPPANGSPRRARRGNAETPRPRRRVKIESAGILPADRDIPRDAVSMLAAAADSCLRRSRYGRRDIELLINAGVYRNDFLCEPAVASIVAGRLRTRDDRPDSSDSGTLAFDLTSGSLGVLEACWAASNMIASGNFRTAMVMAAEIEVNSDAGSGRRLGLEETGSALILDGSTADGPGFGAFHFQSFPRHLHKFGAHSAVVDGKTVLCFERDPAWESSCRDCIAECVAQFLKRERHDRSEIAVVLPPLISAGFVSRLAAALKMPQARVVSPPAGCRDLYTSSLASGLTMLREQNRVRPGEVGLIVGVGSGIQVGCATYHF